VTTSAGYDTELVNAIVTPLKPASSIGWWTRNFQGSPNQVCEVRRWLEDLLPGCGPRADVVLLASELCTNAIVHSQSGEAGGQFSVDLEWTPALVRVVVGDQGSAKAPALTVRKGEAGQWGESGRGLLLVDELADAWGTASHPNRRWVWADVDWQARGGLPLETPDGLDTAIDGSRVIRKAFPGTSIWRGHLTKTWWAAVPGATDAHGLICSPTRDSLLQALARAYPRSVTTRDTGRR
jgi:serine/threonine-protein kinase RsbW